MVLMIRCPACGELKEVEEAQAGARRFCRRCGAVMEIVCLDPPQAVKVPRCAEDFGA